MLLSSRYLGNRNLLLKNILKDILKTTEIAAIASVIDVRVYKKILRNKKLWKNFFKTFIFRQVQQFLVFVW